MTKMEDDMINAIDRETISGVAFFLCLWKVLCACVRRFVSDDIIDDCPRWSWAFGGGLQATFYPTVLYLAFRNGHCNGNPQKLLSWMNSSWGNRKSSFYERTFFCGFFAYLLNDLPNTDLLLFVHHIVCMTGIAFALWLPRGHIPMLVGMCMLEMGSFCLAAPKVIPGLLSNGQYLANSDLRWDRFYWWGMPLSNILCLATCFHNILIDFGIRNRFLETTSKVFFTILTFVLCYMRQEWSNKNMFSSEVRYNNMQPHEKINADEKWISDTLAAILVLLYVTIWGGSSFFAFHQSYRSEGCLFPEYHQGKSSKVV
mmetsp:Transcript_28703/g.37523  ORF Transcript_28703/g.37523 Transcript_28703/m.37523 type:complete len:314 (+) Transcript_28703:102-1043(+)